MVGIGMYGFNRCPKCKKEFYAPNAWGYLSRGKKCCSWTCKRALDAIKAPCKPETRGRKPRDGFIRLTEEQGNLIKARMKRAGVTYVAAAKRCGVAQSTLSDWLNGYYRSGKYIAQRLDKFLAEKEKSLAAATV